MPLILFHNSSHAKNKTESVELFGLSRSGKSTLLKNISQKSPEQIYSPPSSFIIKLLFLLKFIVVNPIKTFLIFMKLNSNPLKVSKISMYDRARLFLLRNSYLCGVIAKHTHSQQRKKKFYIDEYLAQSLFMILQNKTTKEEIFDVLALLPPLGKILLVETTEQTRYQRIRKTRLPAEQISKEFAQQWMKNMEFNYPLIKEILLEQYGPHEQIKSLH